MTYPEHDKMAAVKAESQAQGELLEWLQEQGLFLMKWKEWDEEQEHECLHCSHLTNEAMARCRCNTCGGKHPMIRTVRLEGWVSDSRNITDLLADYHQIDLKVIETEKRAMLDAIRAAQS